MACNATDIPSLSFPRDEIIEIIPASYNNEATRIKIPGLPDEMIPGSPEDIRIPVPPSAPPSGQITPMGLDAPMSGKSSPRQTAGISLNGRVAFLEPGEGQTLLADRALRKAT